MGVRPGTAWRPGTKQAGYATCPGSCRLADMQGPIKGEEGAQACRLACRQTQCFEIFI